MPAASEQEMWLWWVGGLILGFPLIMLILNELIVRLERRGNPFTDTFAILRNLVLPALALLILLTKVIGLEGQDNLIRFVETLFWILIIHASLSGFKALLFQEMGGGVWRAKVPELFLDLSRFFLVFCGAALVLSNVWKINLAGLVAALGLGSLVIGLALQDALKNLFSGIMLLFERPFTLGDWLKVGDRVGRVIQINWRSIHLQTPTRELIVIPNSTLAQGNFSNYSRPTRLHVEPITISFSYDDPPNRVKQILKQAALSTDGVLSDPEPLVSTVSYDDFSIAYRISLFVESYEKMPAIRDAFVTRLWYIAKRYHLTMPYPIQVQGAQVPVPDASARATDLLRSLPIFGSLIPQLLSQTQGDTPIKYYGKGERILKEGERLPGLCLILNGQVAILVRDRFGQEQEVTRLSRGSFFGERSLLSGQVSDVCVIALDDLEILVLASDIVTTLLDQMPQLAREIGEIMEARRKEVRLIKDKG
jgi:small-conductance mechanosensitive channel